MGVEVAVERLGDALDVERGTGTSGYGDGGQLACFLLFERDVEDLQLLEQRIAGLAAVILVGASSQRFARLRVGPTSRIGVSGRR